MTKEELIQALGELFAPLMNKTDSKYTLYQWLDEWYNVYKAPRLKPSGLYQIRNCIDTHLKPHLQDKPLNDITAFDVQKAINEIDSSRMRKYAFDTISAALKQAFRLDLLKDNIAYKLVGVTHKRDKGVTLSKEQERQFIEYIKGNKLENLFLFYLASGVRKSEALSIKWSHIDKDNNRLFIDGTKTTCSKRYVPLFDDIKLILERLPHTSEYIFPYPDYVVSNTWRWLKNKYKLPYCIHSLRHTFSTRHYENGVPAKIIQKWLGHSKIDTTLNIYTDVLTEFEAEVFTKANNARKIVQQPIYTKS